MTRLRRLTLALRRLTRAMADILWPLALMAALTLAGIKIVGEVVERRRVIAENTRLRVEMIVLEDRLDTLRAVIQRQAAVEAARKGRR